MNQSNFKPIFSISISHLFFDDKIDPSVIIQPSESTKELMSRYGILLNQTVKGCELYGNTEESIVVLLKNIMASTETISFDFDLKSNNPNFIMYTDIPLESTGQIFFSSDNVLNRIENEHVILHPSLNKEQSSNRLGKLHIRFTDLLNLSNSRNSNNFHVLFGSRSTQWQYYIVNRSSISLEGSLLKSEPSIQFSSPTEVDLQNEDKAMLFISETDIPMSNVSKHKIDLVNSEGKVLFRGLPYPDPNHVSMIKYIGVKSLASPIYVYL